MSGTKLFILACWVSVIAFCQANKRLYEDETPKVRLFGGAGKHEGTVEIITTEGYGAICDDLWDIQDANIICRMLGFSAGALVAWKNSHFGSSSFPIAYDDVKCQGFEESIYDCHKSEKWLQDCSHLEHAGVTCNTVSSISMEMYINDSWHTIIDEMSNWGFAESTVYCRSLGFNLVYETSQLTGNHYPFPDAQYLHTSCTGDEEHLTQCRTTTHQVDIETQSLKAPHVTCRSINLVMGRSGNEGVLVLEKEDVRPNMIATGRKISEEGARQLCRKLGFADVGDTPGRLQDFTHIWTGYTLYDSDMIDLLCQDEETSWWECENSLQERQANFNISQMTHLVCKTYHSIATDTSFDYWSMEIIMDPHVAGAGGSSKITTTTTRSPPIMPEPQHDPVGCTLKGSYDINSFDDIKVMDCDIIQKERGPVGNAIIAVTESTSSFSLNFPKMSSVLTIGSSSFEHTFRRAFCRDRSCDEGFALAFWFTLPACTKDNLAIEILNLRQSCLVLDARSRIRMRADEENDDGQMTMLTKECSMTTSSSVGEEQCSEETLFSRTFTSTPFETEMRVENGCGYLIWNHVTLNIHQRDSEMTCELYINGEAEIFDCQPVQECLSLAPEGLSVISELGDNTGLDEMGLWRRPLDQSEVLSLYYQPTDVPENFTGIPLWVVPLEEKTRNCPCEEPSTMDLVEQIETETEITASDLVQITESLSLVNNMSDFTLITDTNDKYDAIQSSLDVISSVTQISAAKAMKYMENAEEFHEVGHNLLGSVEALQSALLKDVTILNHEFTSDEIEITTATTVAETDFIYRGGDQTLMETDETTVHISSKNFKAGSRISVALLKGSAAAFLPRRLSRRNRTALRSNVTSPVLNVQSTGINVTSLVENITLIIPHNSDTMKPEDASFFCSFYELESKSFSDEGCTRVLRESNDQSTTCSCNHMTSFAILMAVTGTSLSRGNEFALDVITYTGCGLSIIALIFSLIVIGVSKLKSIRIRILTNQCVAMFLAQTLFVSLVENASVNMVACKVVAAILHLLFLSVIFWMFVQGIYMYMKTTMVHKATIPLKYFIIIGWGVPVAVVGATAAANIDFYGMNNICWLNRDNGGIWIFVVPALAIALMNCIVMVLTVKALRSVKVFQNKSDKDKLKSTLKATVVLLPILGVTWITGILVNVSVIFSYLFAISNAFQGLFLFIMQILINCEIRSALRLRKSRILPFNTSSVGESTAMNHSSGGKNMTKSTNNTTHSGVGIASIGGNPPGFVGDPLPLAQ